MKFIGFIENLISFQKILYCYIYFKSQPARHSRVKPTLGGFVLLKNKKIIYFLLLD